MLSLKNKENLYKNLKSTLKTDLIPPEIWQASGHEDLKPAAIMVPLFWQHEQLHLLLTKRSDQLKHHSGQVSFPGGGFDKSDGTIRQAAIRETEEEIGVGQEFIKVVGYLDDIKTISGFYVTPFVAILSAGFKISANKDEVAEVFSVPLSFFLDNKNYRKQTANYQGKKVNYYVYQYENYTIWGVTAEIIVKLAKKFKNINYDN